MLCPDRAVDRPLCRWFAVATDRQQEGPCVHAGKWRDYGAGVPGYAMAQLSLMRRIFGNARPGERRQRPRAGTPRGLQVLVVDDSATIRAVLGKMLLQNGHIVVDADGGQAGLELARQRMPDLIFLDVVMPGLNGFAVLRALRQDVRTQDIPVIMISGNPQATEQFYVQRFGADDFMKKPFGRGDVFARIARLVTAGRLSVRRRMSGLAAAADRARAAEPPDRHG